MFGTLDESAKIWIYQSNRFLSEKEVLWLNEELDRFVKDWSSHNYQLKAGFEIQENLFVILAVDESSTTASGCSIDKSVRFLQKIEKDFNIRLMDRMIFACLLNPGEQKPSLFSLDELKEAFSIGTINKETIVYDNLVNTKKDFLHHWKKPLGNSWLNNFIS